MLTNIDTNLIEKQQFGQVMFWWTTVYMLSRKDKLHPQLPVQICLRVKRRWWYHALLFMLFTKSTVVQTEIFDYITTHRTQQWPHLSQHFNETFFCYLSLQLNAFYQLHSTSVPSATDRSWYRKSLFTHDKLEWFSIICYWMFLPFIWLACFCWFVSSGPKTTILILYQ